MIDWLLAPIDVARVHSVSAAVSWHGRLMVIAWCFLLPAGILAARFFKVTPKQDWPRAIDNKAWWHAHNALQYGGGLAVIAALVIIFGGSGSSGRAHAWLGWGVVALTASQFLGGWMRGRKGGPTDPAADGSLHGDHYSMTQRRRIFERIHKSFGYLAAALAIAALVTGLWQANAPRWMWIAMMGWWLLLIGCGVVWQREGRAVDTYQAIWGPDPRHPGNRVAPIGWGVRRRDEAGS